LVLLGLVKNTVLWNILRDKKVDKSSSGALPAT
jgi:hypothetical protein